MITPRYRRHNGNAENLFQLGNINLHTPPLSNVHHVETNDERNLQFTELKGKVKMAAQIGSVNDEDNDFGTLEEQKVPGNSLFLRVGRKTVRTGQIDNFDSSFSFVIVSRLFHNGNAGIIGNGLMQPRQIVEHGGLAGIGLPH